jgi:hypothetical protein
MNTMAHNIPASVLDLPIELIYRIFDHLDPQNILLSLRNVCQRLETITNTYPPYQVNFIF